MDTGRDLLKRLLRLYPAKLVKEHFNITGNSTDVIEAVTVPQNTQEIIKFVRESQIQTRQHVYLYKLNSNFSLNKIVNFPFNIESSTFNNGEYTLFCLPKVTYKVTLYNPLEEDELEFFQPVVIRVKDGILIIHLTKIEKTVSHYYPNDRGATRQGQTHNETGNLQEIISNFNNVFGVTQLDINKGVKSIWDEDLVDSKKVQWRKNSSIATETMDEDFTFKEKYPNEYDNLINEPLVKTMFKYLKEDEVFCDAFDVDPSNGLINIPKFPKNANQVENVISKILANN